MALDGAPVQKQMMSGLRNASCGGMDARPAECSAVIVCTSVSVPVGRGEFTREELLWAKNSKAKLPQRALSHEAHIAKT